MFERETEKMTEKVEEKVEGGLVNAQSRLCATFLLQASFFSVLLPV